MPRVDSIIVGGGVGAVAPFTASFIPYIALADPPYLAATSILKYVDGTGGTNLGLVCAAGGTDPQPTATELLRLKGGAIIEGVAADSVVIGRGASSGAAGTGGVCIGRLATINASTNVAIGQSSSATGTNGLALLGTASGNSAIAIGGTADGGGGAGQAVQVGFSGSASGVSTVAIGGTATATATACITVGANSTNSGAGSIVIGTNVACAVGNSIAIVQGGTTVRTNWCVIHGGTPTNLSSAATPLVIVGGGAMTVTHAGNIVLGHGFTSFAANVCAIGGSATNSFITTLLVGSGNTRTASLGGLNIRCTNGVTTNNLAMGDLTITAPRSTGNATPGAIGLQTGVQGASGNALQTARTGVGVSASTTARDTDLLVYDVDNATLERVTVGVADSGGVGFKLLRIPN